MTPFSGATRLAVIIAGSLLLSSCGLFGGQVNMDLPPAMKQKCPPVGIVAYTGELWSFPGKGRETTDLAYKAEISGLNVQCLDSADGKGLDATISFDVSAVRGPAATSSTVDLPYFVAVTRGNEAVLDKKVYTSTQHFGSDGRSSHRETISAYVPLGTRGKIQDLEVLIGFQLSREELEYNLVR